MPAAIWRRASLTAGQASALPARSSVRNASRYGTVSDLALTAKHIPRFFRALQEVANGSAEVITKTARHAWISSRSLSASNVHERCNLAARHRWSGIESSFLVEKHQGYQYEHSFAYDWNAMKGYHYLMRLAHMINAVAQQTSTLVKVVKNLGIRGFIQFVVETIASPWLNAQVVQARLAEPFQLRL